MAFLKMVLTFDAWFLLRFKPVSPPIGGSSLMPLYYFVPFYCRCLYLMFFVYFLAGLLVY